MPPSPVIFGPVTSSRLGRSLGLDLLGKKICSFDCIYCEVGATTALTLARRPYVPAHWLLDELAEWKKKAAAPLDHLTLGGSGEPCLNSDLAEIIEGAKQLFPTVPVAVLTNSSLLNDPEVRSALALADVVLPSLDTLVEAEFRAVNQPHPDVDLAALAAGLTAFRREFKGKLYLEVLLVAGVNDAQANLERLAVYCRTLAPERVDVTTLSRPGAYPQARAADKKALAAFRTALGPTGKDKSPPTVAIKADFRHNSSVGIDSGLDGSANVATDLQETIFQSLRRRPQTPDQLGQALGLDSRAVSAALTTLVATGRAVRDHEGFFLAKSGA